MTARANLRKDQNNEAIQALSPNQSTLAVVAISGSTLRVALPASAQIIRVAADAACFIKFGTSSVTATTSDMLFPAGAEYYTTDPTWTHVAAIQDGSVTGVVSIAEMK